MTLQELKDNVARSKGYKDWKEVLLYPNASMLLIDVVAQKWALKKAKDFKIWCDHQVTEGRTTHKLYLDWQEATKNDL
jgi:hypothetical protein